jgi:hypothetical protein
MEELFHEVYHELTITAEGKNTAYLYAPISNFLRGSRPQLETISLLNLAPQHQNRPYPAVL